MVQPSTPAKTKRTTGSPAAKKAAGAKRARGSGTAAADLAASATGSEAARLGGDALAQSRLSKAARLLLEGRRRDLEALIEANKKSYAGLQALVKRRAEMVKDAIAQWQDVAAIMRSVGPRESIAQLDELAKGAFKLALENIRELAELAATTQADAFEIARQRIRDNIDEVSELLERR